MCISSSNYVSMCILSIRVLVSKLKYYISLLSVTFICSLYLSKLATLFCNTKPAHAGLRENLVHESRSTPFGAV